MFSKTYQQAAAANLSFIQNSNKRRQDGQATNPPPKTKKGERLKKGDVAMFCGENDIRTENDVM